MSEKTATGAAGPRMDGSPAAFDAFVQARAEHLVRIARGLLRQPADAEDVVQEVLVRMYQHWSTVCSREVPEAYVRRSLVNACISKQRGSIREIPMVDSSVPDVPVRVAYWESTLDAASMLAERDRMMSLLRELPARQRACLVLRHYENLNDTEIGEVMGVTANTVRSNIHHALATLRRMLVPATTDQEFAL